VLRQRPISRIFPIQLRYLPLPADIVSGTAVISQKRIPQDDGASEQTLMRIVQLLLQGIELHAIEGDPDDFAQLRASIQRLTNSLDGGLATSELLAQAGSALRTLEDYNRRTARYLRRPAGEWQAIVIMLTSAIAAMAAAGEENTRRLREIAGRVRSASGGDEVHKIRLELSECLTELQLETRRQKEQDARVPLPATVESAPSPVDNDPVTGFASRPQAEEALAHAWQTDPPSYVAVMALDRLQIFNTRFGRSVGDEILRYFGEFLGAQLRASDQIFRWSGTTLVALLPRPNCLEIVREEVARLMEARCEHTVQTPSRTILLAITARWAVFPSVAAPRLLIHKIDAFAEAKATLDPES
jgi:diguanylate cyclase (GGDEF)-like protein